MARRKRKSKGLAAAIAVVLTAGLLAGTAWFGGASLGVPDQAALSVIKRLMLALRPVAPWLLGIALGSVLLAIGWRIQEKRTLRSRDHAKRITRRPVDKPEFGWVYVLRNPSVLGLKIGFTEREAEIRAQELSPKTCLPTPYEVVYKLRLGWAGRVEQQVHRLLEDKRISMDREFFDVDLATARRAIDEARRQVKEAMKGGR